MAVKAQYKNSLAVLTHIMYFCFRIMHLKDCNVHNDSNKPFNLIKTYC